MIIYSREQKTIVIPEGLGVGNCEQAIAKAREEGYAEGHSDGYDEGYEIGFEQGYASGQGLTNQIILQYPMVGSPDLTQVMKNGRDLTINGVDFDSTWVEDPFYERFKHTYFINTNLLGQTGSVETISFTCEMNKGAGWERPTEFIIKIGGTEVPVLSYDCIETEDPESDYGNHCVWTFNLA